MSRQQAAVAPHCVDADMSLHTQRSCVFVGVFVCRLPLINRDDRAGSACLGCCFFFFFFFFFSRALGWLLCAWLLRCTSDWQ